MKDHTRKSSLGKVFISHSSKDKPFVRKLVKRLEKEGYRCWLDEVELVPGDMLSTRLAEVLQESRVVIAVMTEHSLKSNWLKFELNKAAEWMVDGKCRIIPILLGDVKDSNPLLKGLIYADFRKSVATGNKAVLAALKKEADAAIQEGWQLLDSLVERAFGGTGSASGGEYDSMHYQFVEIDGLKTKHSSPHTASIVFDAIHDYGHDNEPLKERWWSEYKETQERYGETYHLVVTERPTEIAAVKPSAKLERISTVVDRQLPNYPSVVVFAYVGGLKTEEEKFAVILNAKKELETVARKLGHLAP
jgi:hypothetical protein